MKCSQPTDPVYSEATANKTLNQWDKSDSDKKRKTEKKTPLQAHSGEIFL